MGFLSASATFSRFRVLDPLTDGLRNELEDRLRKFAFRDIDNTREMRSVGWVSVEDMLDAQFGAASAQKGSLLVFCLRQDTRRIPPAVIKKHIAVAMQAELARMPAEGKKHVGRERKKELAEQVMLHLKERFLPVPAVFDVVWFLQENEIWFASIQSAMLDVFMELFLDTFELHLELLGPLALAESILGDEAQAQLESVTPTAFADEGQSYGN